MAAALTASPSVGVGAIPKYDVHALDIATNDGPLPRDMIGWLPSFPADTPDNVLRDELKTKGVVHVKGVMPRQYVLDVRRRWFTTVRPTGVLKSGTDPVDGIFSGGDAARYVWPKVGRDNAETIDDIASEDDYAYLAAKMHLADWTDEFSGNKYITGLVKRVEPMFEDPVVLRRQIFRTNMPYSTGSTSTHYDQIFLRHGAPVSTVTAWVPIGDCPPESGGLIYLEGSSELGRTFEDDFSRQSRAKNLSEEERKASMNVNMTQQTGIGWDAGKFRDTFAGRRRWLVGDYEAGDVVLHDMYMMHASGANHDPQGRIRFSVDLRFVDRQGNFDRRWMFPFAPGDRL